MAKKKKRKAAPGDIATNRQASFRFNLLDRFEAGIVLQGSERRLRLGDSVRVEVDRVDAPRGRVDLIPAESYS